jgi:hypothetical protein
MADAPPAAPAKGSTFGFLGHKVFGKVPVWVIAVAAVGGYYWYTHYGPGKSSSAAGAMQTDPAGNQCAVINPDTGYCPGTPEDTAALANMSTSTDTTGAAAGAGTSGGGTGDGGGGTSGGGGTTGGTGDTGTYVPPATTATTAPTATTSTAPPSPAAGAAAQTAHQQHLAHLAHVKHEQHLAHVAHTEHLAHVAHVKATKKTPPKRGK